MTLEEFRRLIAVLGEPEPDPLQLDYWLGYPGGAFVYVRVWEPTHDACTDVEEFNLFSYPAPRFTA
jgi:hypothetical protein